MIHGARLSSGILRATCLIDVSKSTADKGPQTLLCCVHGRHNSAHRHPYQVCTHGPDPVNALSSAARRWKPVRRRSADRQAGWLEVRQMIETRQLVIVRRNQLATLAMLAQAFADEPGVRLMWDRRLRERRQAPTSLDPEERWRRIGLAIRGRPGGAAITCYGASIQQTKPHAGVWRTSSDEGPKPGWFRQHSHGPAHGGRSAVATSARLSPAQQDAARARRFHS
jgi:hypothetical protein